MGLMKSSSYFCRRSVSGDDLLSEGPSDVAQSYFSPRKITLRYAFKCLYAGRRVTTRDPPTNRWELRAHRGCYRCNHGRSTKAHPPDALPTPPSPGSGEYTPPFRGIPRPSAERDQKSAAGTAIPTPRGSG